MELKVNEELADKMKELLARKGEDQMTSALIYFTAFHELKIDNEEKAIALASSFAMTTWDEYPINSKNDLYSYFNNCLSIYPHFEEDSDRVVNVLIMIGEALMILLAKTNKKKKS